MKKIVVIGIIVLFIGIQIPTTAKEENIPIFNDITVKINIAPYTIIYEGDVINCTITGNPTVKYWYINNYSKHTTFHYNDPIIFDPEPTPLDTNYVNLTVYAENEQGNASDTAIVIVKRIYFGDIHWHTQISDGKYNIDTVYKNALNDNYLDFAACTDHATLIDFWIFSKNKNRPEYDLIRTILHKIFGFSDTGYLL